MATFLLVLAIFALFSSVKTETNGEIIPVLEELNTTVELPCRCPGSPESTVVVHWYKNKHPGNYGQALASWFGSGETSSSQGFGITDEFSIIMPYVNLTSEGLYRCIVTPAGGADECTHDVKLKIYANPDVSPVIEYIREAKGFNVTCSISNVFPMTFPKLTTKGVNGTTRSYSNKDGTYNTAVTHLFPANEKDTTIECLYSNMNFKSMSSLRIDGSDTIDQPENEDTMAKNMTYTNIRYTPSGLWMVWIILIIEVLFFILIVCAFKSGRELFKLNLRRTVRNNTDEHHDEHHGESSKDDEPAKSMKNLLFGKLFCAVITITIQIAIVIILVAYLATVQQSV